MTVVAGLDFGTTFSTITVRTKSAAINLKQVESEFIPTIIGWDSKNSVYNYGYNCVDHKGTTKAGYQSYRDFKRWVGVDHNGITRLVEKLQPAYRVSFSHADSCVAISSVEDGSKYKSILDLYAIFLQLIVTDLNDNLGQSVTSLVVSVPANYGVQQRNFLLRAGARSGVNVTHIMNEPSAALFAASIETLHVKPVEYYVVYDFGGGTFDVSIVGRYRNKFSVVYSEGDNYLGGRDVDMSISESVCMKLGIPTHNITEVSGVKDTVCSYGSTELLEFLYEGKKYSTTLDITTVRQCAAQHISKSFDILRLAVEASGIKTPLTFVPIGGSSTLPGVKEFLATLTGVAIDSILNFGRRRTAVAEGCALFASTVTTKDFVFIDCLSKPIVYASAYYKCIPVIPAGAPLPISVEFTEERTELGKTIVYMLFEGTSKRVIDCDYLTRLYFDSNAIGLKTTPWVARIKISLSSTGVLKIQASVDGYSWRDNVDTEPRVERRIVYPLASNMVNPAAFALIGLYDYQLSQLTYEPEPLSLIKDIRGYVELLRNGSDHLPDLESSFVSIKSGLHKHAVLSEDKEKEEFSRRLLPIVEHPRLAKHDA